MMILETLGKNTKTFRIARGFTQQSLAERAGISLVFLQSIEAGRKWVSPETISALARTLAVRETEFFAENGDARETGRPDPREVLALICESMGVVLPRDSLKRAKVSPYRMLLRERVAERGHIDLSHMPEDLFYDMVTLCQQPGCEWEKFREALRALKVRR